MKDTIITKEQKKKELKLFSLCFVIAFIANVISIIVYGTQWIEVVSQLHIVLLLAIGFYILAVPFRYLIKRLRHKK